MSYHFCSCSASFSAYFCVSKNQMFIQHYFIFLTPSQYVFCVKPCQMSFKIPILSCSKTDSKGMLLGFTEGTSSSICFLARAFTCRDHFFIISHRAFMNCSVMSTCLITEIKQRWATLVFGWLTIRVLAAM